MQRFLLFLVLFGLALLIGLLAMRYGTSPTAITKPAEAANAAPAKAVDEPTASVDPEAKPGAQPAVVDGSRTVPNEAPRQGRHFHLHGIVRLKDSTVPMEQTHLVLEYRRMSPLASNEGRSQRRLDRRIETIGDDKGAYSFSVPEHAQLVSLEVRPEQIYLGSESTFAPYAFLGQTIDLRLEEILGDRVLDVIVLPPTMLRVRVLDYRTSELLPEAHVGVSAVNLSMHLAAHTPGCFEFQLLGRETIFRDSVASVDAAAPGFAPASVAIPPMRSDGSLPDLTVRLQPGSVVSGLVFVGTDEPAPHVRLLLLPCLDGEQSETREVAGVFSEQSDTEGRFHFDELPPFERAWLLVRTQQRDHLVWYGEKRVLLEAHAGTLENLRVQLELETSVDVQATFPDGIKADRSELDLLRADADGKPWIPVSSTYLPCPTGTSVRVIARGWRRHLGIGSPCWSAETVRTFSLDPEKPAVVTLELVPDPGYTPPATNPDRLWQSTRQPGHGQQPLVVTARDGALGLVASASVNDEDFGTWPAAATEDGALTLQCVPGWRLIEVSAPAHRSRFFEVLVRDRQPRSLDVVLDRLR